MLNEGRWQAKQQPQNEASIKWLLLEQKKSALEKA